MNMEMWDLHRKAWFIYVCNPKISPADSQWQMLQQKMNISQICADAYNLDKTFDPKVSK